MYPFGRTFPLTCGVRNDEILDPADRRGLLAALDAGICDQHGVQIVSLPSGARVRAVVRFQADVLRRLCAERGLSTDGLKDAQLARLVACNQTEPWTLDANCCILPQEERRVRPRTIQVGNNCFLEAMLHAAREPLLRMCTGRFPALVPKKTPPTSMFALLAILPGRIPDDLLGRIIGQEDSLFLLPQAPDVSRLTEDLDQRSLLLTLCDIRRECLSRKLACWVPCTDLKDNLILLNCLLTGNVAGLRCMHDLQPELMPEYLPEVSNPLIRRLLPIMFDELAFDQSGGERYANEEARHKLQQALKSNVNVDELRGVLLAGTDMETGQQDVESLLTRIVELCGLPGLGLSRVTVRSTPAGCTTDEQLARRNAIFRLDGLETHLERLQPFDVWSGETDDIVDLPDRRVETTVRLVTVDDEQTRRKRLLVNPVGHRFIRHAGGRFNSKNLVGAICWRGASDGTNGHYVGWRAEAGDWILFDAGTTTRHGTLSETHHWSPVNCRSLLIYSTATQDREPPADTR